MQDTRSTGIRIKFAIALTLMIAVVALVMPMSVAAQGAPTATPTDPIWLGFSAARTRVQEEKKVDLTFVRRWDFYQDDWSTANAEHPQKAAGIDGCVSTTSIVDARPIFYGWTFVITSLRGDVYTVRVSFDTRETAICDLGTTATAPSAPTPSGTAVAGLPAPIPGSASTGSFALGGHIANFTDASVRALNASGMTWIKKQMKGVGLDWAKGIIASAKVNNMKVLLSVVGDRDRLGANFDAYIQEYAQLVGQVAAAGADAIEVWNEPNIEREWPVGRVNGAEYTKLLAAASVAIRQANPNTIIISGAPAPTGAAGAAGCVLNQAAGVHYCNDDTFMQQMAAAGAGQYFDCVGLHYNEGVLPPNANSGDPRGEFPTRYFGSMTARGKAAFPNKQICYTEFGYLSGEGMPSAIPAAFNWTPNDPITVAEQAAWLAQAATLAAQRGDIRLMIIWNVDFARWDSDPQGGYAIIRPDGSCPACTALGTVMKK
jgi:hypothetical protein